jgi:hypothetical protein
MRGAELMANVNTAVARPAATSWGAVLGGWIATIGASVLFAPVAAGLIAVSGQPQSASDIALAVPVVLGILVSYLIGGYVAGRMAGYRTSWHGMMTAFFSLFVLLLVLLAGAAADAGLFASSGVGKLTDVVPGMREWNVDSFGAALSFGAILGFLAAIFGGWLGGLLAPSHVVAVAPVQARPVTPIPARPAMTEARMERRTQVVREGGHGMLPSFGRKGGERVQERTVERDVERPVDDVHTTRVEKI